MGKRTVVFYLLYAVAAFVFFLVLLFPGERTAQYLSQQLNTGFEYGEISIDRVGPSFPPAGAKASRIELIIKDRSTVAQAGTVMDQTLNIHSLSIYPRISTLYKSDKYLDFKASAYNGTATGTVQLQPLSLQTPPSYLSLDMNLSGMEVSELKHHMEGFDVYLSFRINGDITYGGSLRRIDESTGVAEVNLSQCVVRSDNAFLKQMKISRLTFETVGIEVKKEKSVVNIHRFDAAGPEMKIKLKGSIILKNPVEASVLKLKGEFQPDSSHISSLSGLSALSMLFTGSDKGIPFKVTGTLRQPRAHL